MHKEKGKHIIPKTLLCKSMYFIIIIILPYTNFRALHLVPGTGLLVLAEAKRRTTAGGGALFTRRFAFSAHRNRRARCMTCGPGPHARGWIAGCSEDEGAH
jgi:hypothetical protein